MREIVTTRECFAKNNPWLTLAELRELVETTTDLAGDSRVTGIEMEKSWMRGLRVVERVEMDDD